MNISELSHINSVTRPVPNSDEISITIFECFTLCDFKEWNHDDENYIFDMRDKDNDTDLQRLSSDTLRKDLSDLIRDLCLSK